MSELKSLTCSSCNSNDVEIVNKIFVKCNVCGTKSILPESVRSNISIHSEPSGYRVQAEEKPSDFKRNLLVGLTNHKETTPHFLDCDINSPTVKYRHFAFVECEIDFSYTVSIGYDKTITKNVQERYYDSKSKRHKTRWVEKREHVTEWSPLSNTYHHESIRKVNLDGYSLTDDDALCFFEHYSSINKEQLNECFIDNSDVSAPHQINGEVMSRIKNESRDEAVAICKKKLPGDKQKDFFTSSTKIKVKSTIPFCVPVYASTYSLDGITYQAELFADGNIYDNPLIETPLDNSKEAICQSMKEDGKRNTIYFKIAGWLFVAAALVAFILKANESYYLGISVAGIVAAIIFFVSSKKCITRKETEIHKYRESVEQNNLALKIIRLESIIGEVPKEVMPCDKERALSEYKKAKTNNSVVTLACLIVLYVAYLIAMLLGGVNAKSQSSSVSTYTQNETTTKEQTVSNESTTSLSDNTTETADIDFMALYGFSAVEGAPGSEQVAASLLDAYIVYTKLNTSYTPVGRCDSENPFLRNGYLFATRNANGEISTNDYFYVIPADGTVLGCVVGSEIILCWKDGLPCDEEKADQFVQSILGSEACLINPSIKGYYSYWYKDYTVLVNWKCDKIYVQLKEDYNVEVYPNDEFGFFQNNESFFGQYKRENS